MKALILLFASTLVFAAHANTTSARLKCTAKIQVDGQTQTEDFTVDEQLSADSVFPTLNSAYSEKLSADGRFKINLVGYQVIANPTIVRLTVFIYDATTRTGAQSGDPGIDSPASALNDLLYIFDSNGRPGPPKNFVSTHCEIQ